MIQKIAGFRLLVCRWNLISLCCDKFAEQRIIPGSLCDFHHVTGSCIVRFIRQSVWIIKMRILTSELCCALVHQFYEFLYGTACFLCQCESHLVGRFQHQSHQSLLHCKNLISFRIDGRASCFNSVGSFLRHGDRVTHFQILAGKECSHNLSNAGRIKFVICILGIKNGICNSIHQYCRLPFNAGTGWPSFDGICVCGLRISCRMSSFRSYRNVGLCGISHCRL